LSDSSTTLRECLEESVRFRSRRLEPSSLVNDEWKMTWANENPLEQSLRDVESSNPVLCFEPVALSVALVHAHTVVGSGQNLAQPVTKPVGVQDGGAGRRE